MKFNKVFFIAALFFLSSQLFAQLTSLTVNTTVATGEQSYPRAFYTTASPYIEGYACASADVLPSYTGNGNVVVKAAVQLIRPYGVVDLYYAEVTASVAIPNPNQDCEQGSLILSGREWSYGIFVQYILNDIPESATQGSATATFRYLSGF